MGRARARRARADPRILGEIRHWLGERLAWLHRHGPARRPGTAEVRWPTLAGQALPERAGPAPAVSVTTPQQQESQNAPPELQEELYERLSRLVSTTRAPSAISVPGARAFLLDRAGAHGPDEAFILPAIGEFAHLHPAYDGGLHLVLPPDLAHDSLVKGWAAALPSAGSG